MDARVGTVRPTTRSQGGTRRLPCTNRLINSWPTSRQARSTRTRFARDSPSACKPRGTRQREQRVRMTGGAGTRVVERGGRSGRWLTRPPRRTTPSAAGHPVRGDAPGGFGHVLAYDGATWQFLTHSTPNELQGPALAFTDEAAGQIVMLAGVESSTASPHVPATWTWDGGTWVPHHLAEPAFGVLTLHGQLVWSKRSTRDPRRYTQCALQMCVQNNTAVPGALVGARHQRLVRVANVPGVGVEPTRGCPRRFLRPLRLPFRHPGDDPATLPCGRRRGGVRVPVTDKVGVPLSCCLPSARSGRGREP